MAHVLIDGVFCVYHHALGSVLQIGKIAPSLCGLKAKFRSVLYSIGGSFVVSAYECLQHCIENCVLRQIESHQPDIPFLSVLRHLYYFLFSQNGYRSSSPVQLVLTIYSLLELSYVLRSSAEVGVYPCCFRVYISYGSKILLAYALKASSELIPMAWNLCSFCLVSEDSSFQEQC